VNSFYHKSQYKSQFLSITI